MAFAAGFISRATGLSCIAGLALAALLPPVPGKAESDPTVQSWRIIRPAAVAAPTGPQTYRPRRRYDAQKAKYPDDWTLGLIMPEIRVAPELILDPNRTAIAVVGDSLADALAAGLEADPAIKADFLIRQKTVSASGLVREDFHDWPKALAALAAENPGLAAMVVMVGLNDRQVIRAGETSLEPLSEGWREAYRKRVDAVIGVAQSARVPLVWVGLPVMRSAKLSSDLAVLNEMVRDRVTAAGETYVDTADGFADQAGGFSATGPDVIGDSVRLRGPDGIHFSPAGQRKLAFFVEKPLRKRLGDRPKSEAPALATLPPAGSMPTPALPGADAAITLPVPAALSLPMPQIPIIRPRVEIGETRTLAPANPAASLVSRPTKPPEDPATRDLFERGLAPPPRAGRADDFRWR